MALPILDGNQSATTLSSILTSGEHIPAHTVVSLGTQAITDISGAVSGSVVSISNFPATQTIAGTVTAFGEDTVSGGFLPIPLNDGGEAVLVDIKGAFGSGVNVPISGTVTANGGDGTFLIGGLRFGNKTALSLDGGTGYLLTKVESLPALVAGTAQIGSVTASISNSVTIASLPAISGTVTANLSISSTVITSGSFSSLSSATLVPENPARKMATVFNLGAGQLFINAGVTATTLGGGFMVALSSGDFYECDYTTTTLSAIFATAGTASWMSH